MTTQVVDVVVPLRGKAFDEEVCTEEYLSWKEQWDKYSLEEKLDLCDEVGAEWESHDNVSINNMRMSMAYQAAVKIEKYKPEYQDKDVRNALKGNTRLNVRPTKMTASQITIQAPIDLPSTHDDDGLEVKIKWPQMPEVQEPMGNFDTPSWFDVMVTMVNFGRHISLEGPPSIGKDTAVEQLAALAGVPLVTIGGDGGFRTRDLIGGQHLVGGDSFFEVGEYAAAAIKGCWVLLTEVNAADPSALMYINRQLAAPHVVNVAGRSYPVHPNFRLFVSYNHGLVGTKPLPQSFKDRFFSIKEKFFTKASLTKRLKTMEWSVEPEHQKGLEMIVDFGIAMWEAHADKGQMRYQITTRRLRDAIALYTKGGFDIIKAVEYGVISAIDSPIESGAATQVWKTVVRQATGG